MDKNKATEIAFKNGYKKGAMDVLGFIELTMNEMGYVDNIDLELLKKKYTENENDRTTGD